MTGRNTQTNSTSDDHRAGNSGKAAKGFRLGYTPNAAQWHLFEVKLRALVIFGYL
jgi:hypothetical protein